VVYAIFQDEVPGWDFKVSFIVMEYIPGTTVLSAWETLSASAKRDIVSQLRRHMDELRSIPSPGYYGGVWRQQIRDRDFERRSDGLPYPEPEITGPHETEAQLVEGMLRCLEQAFIPYEGGPERRERHLAYFRRHYHSVFKGHPPVFKGHPPVFTHANFFPGNVILRPDGSDVIIDWEHSGWYPTFWEYCGTMWLLDHESDWDDLVYDILDEYEAEMGWFVDHRENIFHRIG
jgi:hypothetical protein